MCFPVAVLKGLCVLCAQRQKRKIDQEGKGGVKGGVEGGSWTSASDALPLGNVSHMQAADTQDPAGPPSPSLSLSLSLPINTDTAARLTAPRPPQPDSHHTDAQTRTRGCKMDLHRVSPVLFRGAFPISSGNGHCRVFLWAQINVGCNKPLGFSVLVLCCASWLSVTLSVPTGTLGHTEESRLLCRTCDFPQCNETKCLLIRCFLTLHSSIPSARGAEWCLSSIPSLGHASHHC